jgi:hypothetical protein
MWHSLAHSVVGSAHEKLGESCQDSTKIESFKKDGASYVAVALSDGAGSAPRASAGSRFVVDEWCNRIQRIARIDIHSLEEQAIAIITEIRNALAALADSESRPLRDFHCTLLAGLFYEDLCLVLQIGDGAWVLQIADSLQVATWPQTGDYAGETVFLTSDDYLRALQSGLYSRCIRAALFSDGLQHLALNFRDRCAHRPFFEPMFRAMQQQDDVKTLEPALNQFLTSAAVSERTDDDRSLGLLLFKNHAGF